MAKLTLRHENSKVAEDQDGFQYEKSKMPGRWIKLGHKDDPPCSGSGYAHRPHGNCSGYSQDRT
jgi:hypothetical protein